MKKIVFGLILLLAFKAAPAQHLADAAGLKQLKFFEDSLKVLGNRFINDENELERKNANYKFIKTLVSALKVPGSYHYAFDSLKNISLINAPDNRFRMMAWHILNNDGSYRFYGAIQMNSAVLQLYPLEDYSPLLKNPEDSVTDNHKWYGAQYYKIIQPDAAQPFYTLLGWKGNTIKTTKKVIEILSFSNGRPVLGMPLFMGNGKTRRRVVFEYARQASMLLKYNADSRLIVFDHLSASDPKTKGKPETYGPDMSYSGYQFKLGKWIFVDNLDMRNIADTHDEQYVDPKKQAVPDKNTPSKKRAAQ